MCIPVESSKTTPFWATTLLSQVAEEYVKTMSDAQAVISVEKSLVSRTGALEFAKRFIIHNDSDRRTDLSPLSLPLIKICSGFASAFVFKKLGCSFFELLSS